VKHEREETTMAEDLKLYEQLFEAVKRRIPALTEQVVEALRSPVTNTLTTEVTRMQVAARDAGELLATAERERAAVERTTAAKRAEGQALDDANAGKRQQGADLDTAIAAKAAEIRAQHDELEKVTAAVVATKRLAAVAV
jgi:hypothetical protein